MPRCVVFLLLAACTGCVDRDAQAQRALARQALADHDAEMARIAELRAAARIRCSEKGESMEKRLADCRDSIDLGARLTDLEVGRHAKVRRIEELEGR